jgi:hypothetical protein
VESLRKGAPKARLIGASSTPVTTKGKPGEADAEINPTIVEHNRMAAGVMKELSVPVDDLYSVLEPHLDLARGDQFHWKPEGYTLLRAAGVRAVEAGLPAATAR